MGHRAPTADRLRHDIDSGRAGSKVNYPDPAAAPLGTDDEAAGTPPTPEAIDSAHRHEVASMAVKTDQHRLDAGAYLYAGIMGVFFAVLAMIAIWFALSREVDPFLRNRLVDVMKAEQVMVDHPLNEVEDPEAPQHRTGQQLPCPANVLLARRARAGLGRRP